MRTGRVADGKQAELWEQAKPSDSNTTEPTEQTCRADCVSAVFVGRASVPARLSWEFVARLGGVFLRESAVIIMAGHSSRPLIHSFERFERKVRAMM